MIEIFTRKPDSLEIPPDQHLIPVKTNDGIRNSLSAILLQDEYYELIIQSRVIMKDIPIVNGLILIPLKIKAFLDLDLRKKNGETIDDNDIQKHKKDVYRLYYTSTASNNVVVPASVKKNMNTFISYIKEDQQSFNSVSHDIGVPQTNMADFMDTLKKIYSL